jgi:hypothetical protein
MSGVLLVATSKVDSAHMRLPAARFISAALAVAGAMISTAIWWYIDLANNQDNLRRDTYASSGVYTVQSQPTMRAPFRSGTPAPNEEKPLVVRPAGLDSGAGSYRLEPPPGDLLGAIKRSNEATVNTTLSPPAGQLSWQEISAEDAARVFEDAVKAAQEKRQLYSSPASPFGPVTK